MSAAPLPAEIGDCANGCECAECRIRHLEYMKARIDEFIAWMDKYYGDVMRRLAEGPP